MKLSPFLVSFFCLAVIIFLQEGISASPSDIIFTAKYIPASSLFISEPNPSHFGNPPNVGRSNKHWTNDNWLKSRFHFSFAEWMDGPSNFGVLRVLNDDLVQPNRGFGRHPHSNAEILSFVLGPAGLTHQDSLGNQETLGRGSVQYMSAGRGVQHSEHNRHPTEALRFLQIWLRPRRYNTKPRYGSLSNNSYNFPKSVENKFFHLVSDLDDTSKQAAPIHLGTDVNMYVAELVNNNDGDDSTSSSAPSVSLKVRRNRAVYIVCAEAENNVEVNILQNGKVEQTQNMNRHDAMSVAVSDEKDDYVELVFKSNNKNNNNNGKQSSSSSTKQVALIFVIEMENPGLRKKKRRSSRFLGDL